MAALLRITARHPALVFMVIGLVAGFLDRGDPADCGRRRFAVRPAAARILGWSARRRSWRLLSHWRLAGRGRRVVLDVGRAGVQTLSAAAGPQGENGCYCYPG